MAFTLGSITSLQLLPTMDEVEYSQEGYFNISKSDRTRSIWNEEPVVFYEGKPNHRVRSENPNNVTSQELLAWEQVLGDDYQSYLEEIGLQYSILSVSPFNGTVVYYMCDLTEEKVELFVDTMKYYVPMGIIVFSNACIVGFGLPRISETQFNVVIELNKYVFESQDTAQLIIRNRDSHEITFGSDYIIQKLVDGEWVKASPFPPYSAFDTGLSILPEERTTTQEIKIDTLESGHYRVSKSINHERTKTELTFILEFDIREGE